MTAVAGTVVSVANFRTPAGRAQMVTSAGASISSCDIAVNFTGTYAAYTSPTTDGFTIAAVTTAIQNARRNGKTVTLLSACGSAPGLESTTPLGACACVVPWQGATTDRICGMLTGGTLAAEHGAALLAQTGPVFLSVEFSEV
jgi:hypothetical protein